MKFDSYTSSCEDYALQVDDLRPESLLSTNLELGLGHINDKAKPL